MLSAFCTQPDQFRVGAFPKTSECDNAAKHCNERFAHSTTNLLVLLLIAGASGTFDATFYVQQDCCRHLACCQIQFVLVGSLKLQRATMPPSTTKRGLLTQQPIYLSCFSLLVQVVHLMLQFGCNKHVVGILHAVVLVSCQRVP